MHKPTFDELVAQVRKPTSLRFDQLTNYEILVASLVCEFGLYQLSVRILVHLGLLSYDNKILLPNGKPWVEPNQRLKDAGLIFDYTRANIQVVRRDYELYPDHNLFLAYIELRRAIDEIIHEVHKRMAKNKVGALLAFGDLYPKQEQLVADVKRAIKVERLTSKRPQKYDDEELQVIAIEKALQLLADQRNKAGQVATAARQTGKLPFQQFFQPHNVTEAFWMSEFKQGWWPKFTEGTLTNHLSVLNMEAAPEKVRQHLRDFWKKWEAQKRTGEEVPLDDVDQTVLRRSRSGTWRKRSEILQQEPAPDISARMFEVMKQAKKRWGDKAVKAVKFCLDGKTEEEASRLAGINPRTFRNYKTKLQKIFSSKK
jgi:hypothetical protein